MASWSSSSSKRGGGGRKVMIKIKKYQISVGLNSKIKLIFILYSSLKTPLVQKDLKVKEKRKKPR
jgi:hypothetical protein